MLKEFEAISRARRRAGRDGDRLPARQDPGRVDVLRAPEARRQLSDRRRQHVPQSRTPTQTPQKIELARSTEEEKQSQLKRLADFHARNADAAPAALARLKKAVIDNGNVFAELIEHGARVLARGRSPTRCSRWVGSIGAVCSQQKRSTTRRLW